MSSKAKAMVSMCAQTSASVFSTNSMNKAKDKDKHKQLAQLSNNREANREQR